MDEIGRVYVFLDEGGNLHFDPNGSRYFTLTGMATRSPLAFDASLNELRIRLVESGVDTEYFHATEDTQATRNEVFSVIANHLDGVRVHSVIVEKCKTGPSWREDEKFYLEMMGCLLQYVLNDPAFSQSREFVVITDKLPGTKKKNAIEKALKTQLPKKLPPHAKYTMYNHQAKSWFALQVADYFNWAIYRWWTNGDSRSLDLVRPAVKSQFDIFKNGTTKWY